MFIDSTLEVTPAQQDVIAKYDFDVTVPTLGKVHILDKVVQKYYAFKDASKKGKYFGDTLFEVLKEAVAVREEHEASLAGNGKKAAKILPAKAASKATTPTAATPKAATPKAAASKSTIDWMPEYPDNATIDILVKECPRRPGSAAAAHWALYKPGMTVAALRAAGGIKSKLTTDVSKKRLALRMPKNGKVKANAPQEASKTEATDTATDNVVPLTKAAKAAAKAAGGLPVIKAPWLRATAPKKAPVKIAAKR